MRNTGFDTLALAAGLALFGAVPAFAVTADSAPAHVEMTDDGPILVSRSGMTLYMSGADDSTPGKSQCTNVPLKSIPDQTLGLGQMPVPGYQFVRGCAEKWPAYLADAQATASGDWSLIDRPEGTKQWAYHGHPLYTSVKDHGPGDRNGILPDAGRGFGGRGFHLAAAPLDFPPGFKFTRSEDGLVIATVNDRPVYTPHGVRISKACAGCEDEVFQPLVAPAVVMVSGDWSTVPAGAGQRQYAYKGKPLYAAPDSMTDSEIAEAGGWQMVVFRKAPPIPAAIGKQFTLAGEVYTDKSGKTLYFYNCGGYTGVSCDDPGDGAANMAALCGSPQECARRWHPYTPATDARPQGDWTIVEVAYPMFTDGAGQIYPSDAPHVRVWAYRGRPVYTYYEDQKPGDFWGNQVRLFGFSSFSAVHVPGSYSAYN